MIETYDDRASYTGEHASFNSFLDAQLEEDIMESFDNFKTRHNYTSIENDPIFGPSIQQEFAREFAQTKSFQNVSVDLTQRFLAYKSFQIHKNGFRNDRLAGLIMDKIRNGRLRYWWIRATVLVYNDVDGPKNHDFGVRCHGGGIASAKHKRKMNFIIFFRHMDNLPDSKPERDAYYIMKVKVSLIKLIV